MTAAERRRGLDAHYYTDAGIFAHELEKVFAHSWLLVGHRSQVATPGDLITAQVGHESVIVANNDGAIQGFYNI